MALTAPASDCDNKCFKRSEGKGTLLSRRKRLVSSRPVARRLAVGAGACLAFSCTALALALISSPSSSVSVPLSSTLGGGLLSGFAGCDGPAAAPPAGCSLDATCRNWQSSICGDYYSKLATSPERISLSGRSCRRSRRVGVACVAAGNCGTQSSDGTRSRLGRYFES